MTDNTNNKQINKYLTYEDHFSVTCTRENEWLVGVGIDWLKGKDINDGWLS